MIRLSLSILFVSGSLAAQAHTRPGTPEGLESSTWFAQLQEELATREYHFQRVPGEHDLWSAPNRIQELRSRVGPEGIELFPRELNASRSTESSDSGADPTWVLSLRTSRFGRGEQATELLSATLVAHGNRVVLQHGLLEEWFVNRGSGLEHGWTVYERPDGTGDLWIGIEVGGGFDLELNVDAQGGTFTNEKSETRVPYRHLAVFDATGRAIPAWLENRADGPGIRVHDDGAVYPLMVDPVLTGPEWTARSAQDGAEYGFTLAPAGDVNGDGFADVLVAAPFYDNGELTLLAPSDTGLMWFRV